MHLLISIFVFFTLSANIDHNIQVAFFKINQEQGKLTCDIIFEQKDLIIALGQDVERSTENKIINYVEDHFKLRVNKTDYALNFTFAESKEKHIHLIGTIPNFNKKIKSLVVINECLNNIEDHSNIIEVRLNQEERDFLMNQERTEIKIKF